jgi:AraC-like DNA-binding protein
MNTKQQFPDSNPISPGYPKKSTCSKAQLLILLLALSIPGTICFGQTEKPFRDTRLDSLLKENTIKDAKNHLSQQYESITSYSPDKQAYYFNRSSQIKLTEGDFNEALAEAKKSSAVLEKNPESPFWGETYRALCFAYIRTGKLDSALIFAEKLYDFTKTNGDQNMKRAALVALGNISLQNKSYQKSLQFYSEALQTTQEAKDSINLKVDYYNVGLALSQLNEHEKSNSYLLKAAERAEKEKAFDLLARAYGTMADNYLDQNNFEAQETYLKKANEIAEKIGNQQLLAMGYANLTETALRKGNFRQAVTWGNQSLDYLANRPLIQLQAKLDSMLYYAHKNLGEYKTALEKLEDYDKKRLSIRNEAQKEKLNQLTLQFEVEKKDLLIKNQEISIKEEQAKSRAFLIGIALLATFTFFLAYINVKNARTRRLLFRKEREIDQNSRLLIAPDVEVLETNLMQHVPKESPDEKKTDNEKLFGEIVTFIKEKKLYLDPKLNQQSIVNHFGTNRQYIYEAISSSEEENFRGLINRLRVNEAKELMEKTLPIENSIDFNALSEKVGFNSYATFYRSFKSITGLTPNEYIKELQKEMGA